MEREEPGTVKASIETPAPGASGDRSDRHKRVVIVGGGYAGLFAARRAGAKGYLLKDSGGKGVLHAIRAVASGEAVFGPGVAERILGFFSAPRPATPRRAFPELTEREEEVLSLVAKGKSNQEISRQLFVTLKTVRNHVSNILLQLQVADRAQAVIRAREAGMGQDER